MILFLEHKKSSFTIEVLNLEVDEGNRCCLFSYERERERVLLGQRETQQYAVDTFHDNIVRLGGE